MTADELGRILDELGRRLGPGGEYVFNLAVRQQVIVGVIGALAVALLFVAALVALGYAVIRVRRAPPCNHDEYQYGHSCPGDEALTGAAVLGIVALVALLGFMFASLPNLLNPEYAALRELISQVRP